MFTFFSICIKIKPEVTRMSLFLLRVFEVCEIIATVLLRPRSVIQTLYTFFFFNFQLPRKVNNEATVSFDPFGLLYSQHKFEDGVKEKFW